MPVPTIARQSRRLNAEHGADLPIAQRTQQSFKTGPAYSASRDSEIIIDYLYVLPAERACTIDQAILPALTLKVVLHLIRRGLTNVHTGPVGQMIRGDLIHRRPPSGASGPASASTAPAPGVAALAHPAGVVRRERRELLRTVVVGVLLAAAAS